MSETKTPHIKNTCTAGVYGCNRWYSYGCNGCRHYNPNAVPSGARYNEYKESRW